MYKAFYRKRPFPANVSLLALEWANFTLTVFFVVIRLVKLMITAGFYIGRIDTPFLAKGVGDIKGFELDSISNVFLKDLLAHDAHRHPYIETLGVMYLMKLRYPNHFGKRAGSAWRLLFVYSLMPWMRKYRIHAEEQPMMLRENSDEGNVIDRDGDDESSRRALRQLVNKLKQVLHSRKEDGEKEDNNEDIEDLVSEELIEQVLLARDEDVKLAKQKSTKLELENEALRNRLACLESEQRNTMMTSTEDGGSTEVMIAPNPLPRTPSEETSTTAAADSDGAEKAGTSKLPPRSLSECSF